MKGGTNYVGFIATTFNQTDKHCLIQNVQSISFNWIGNKDGINKTSQCHISLNEKVHQLAL